MKQMKRTRKNKIKNTNKTCKNFIHLPKFQEKFSKMILHKYLDRTNKNRGQFYVKRLTAPFGPSHIKPQDDYYTYINYDWLKTVSLNKKQGYITQVDDFRLVQDKVYYELHGLVMNYIRNNNNALSKNLKSFYESVIHMISIDEGKRLSKEAVELVDSYIEKDDVWGLLAMMNRDEMIATHAPLVWSMAPDPKEPDIFRCSIEPHHFNLANLDIYYDDGTDVEYKTKYRNMFDTHCEELFEMCLGKNHGLNASDVLKTGMDLFNALGCTEAVKEGKEKSYNKVRSSECLKKYGFDWEQFARKLGFQQVPSFFITSNLNYLKCATELMLKNWKTPQWRAHVIWMLLSRIARLTKHWEKSIFQFYGDFERGETSINTSDAVSASLYMSVPFNTFLTNQYYEAYADPQKLEYVTTMANELKIVFRRLLQGNTWLSKETKRYALYKLSKFKFVIGKPDKLREDPLLDYGDNLYDNMMKIIRWRCKKFIQLEGQPYIDMPMMDWTQYPVKMVGTQAYIVNASYTPSKNSIYINLGYIQKPFVDLERGIEYNLARVGFTLGHEMSHGFDDWGSQYDATGKLMDWWTPKDKKIFKEKQKNIVKQYETFAKRDNITFDASIGLGEDMADIAGLATTITYLFDIREYQGEIIPIRKKSFELYFTYFACQQRQFISKKAITAQLKTNPHPLDKYRCNVPLSRTLIFRALYDVKRGDGMWWEDVDKGIL